MFSKVIGQSQLKAQLVRSVNENRVSHAQLFLGQDGTGALPIAVAYAQFILCENKNENDACGTCQSCTKVQKLVHPDLHFSYPVIKVTGSNNPPVSTDYVVQWREAYIKNPYMDENEWLQFINAENKQGNITARECHEIIRKLSLKSYESKHKVLIMWHPEALGKEGNTLLKLIEEPPENTVIILVAEDQDLILNTILSRTQIVKIKKLPYTEIAAALMEREGLDETEATTIAHLANGSYKEALEVLKNEAAEFVEHFREWMGHIFRKEQVQLVNWVDKIAGIGRENQKDYLRYVLYILRETLMMSNIKGYQPKLQEQEQKMAAYLAQQVDFEQVSSISNLINEAHYHIERNANAKILFLDLSIKMINIIFNKQKVTEVMENK